MFKLFLVFLFLAAVISLFAGLIFLMRDGSQSHRTVNSLFLRVFFCALLVAAIAFGLYSGELSLHPVGAF